MLAYAKAQVTSNSCIPQTDGVQEGEQRNTVDDGDDAQVPIQRAAAAWHAALADEQSPRCAARGEQCTYDAHNVLQHVGRRAAHIGARAGASQTASMGLR